jgi:hypothetical protein
MFKWLGKLAIWRRHKQTDTTVCDYGRYVHKLVIQRALSQIMGITQTDLVRLVKEDEVYLNDDLLEATSLVGRLSSGQYSIKMPSQKKIWLFFVG